jgi:hypothetical protein
MAGIVGLTETGKAIDAFVHTLEDRKLGRSILRFITTFTREARKIHVSVSDSHMLLTVLQRHFLCVAEARFASLPPHARKLLATYVRELTRPDFRATTKTQVALRRKAAVAAAAIRA